MPLDIKLSHPRLQLAYDDQKLSVQDIQGSKLPDNHPLSLLKRLPAKVQRNPDMARHAVVSQMASVANFMIQANKLGKPQKGSGLVRATHADLDQAMKLALDLGLDPQSQPNITRMQSYLSKKKP